MQKVNYFNDSEIYNLKEHLRSRFKEELQIRKYLNSDQIEKILSKGAKKYLGVGTKNLKEARIIQPLWWIYVKPNYYAAIPADGGEDNSGIYNFNDEQVELEFKKYEKYLNNRVLMAKKLEQSLCKFN